MQESCTYGSMRGAPSNGRPYRNLEVLTVGIVPCRLRGPFHASLPKTKFASDSPLEQAGFELSVPRERLVPSFSFTPTFPLARVNRPDPIPKAYITRGPMVRIRLPPAVSLLRSWLSGAVRKIAGQPLEVDGG
jgi:hypothetical protein